MSRSWCFRSQVAWVTYEDCQTLGRAWTPHTKPLPSEDLLDDLSGQSPGRVFLLRERDSRFAGLPTQDSAAGPVSSSKPARPGFVMWRGPWVPQTNNEHKMPEVSAARKTRLKILILAIASMCPPPARFRDSEKDRGSELPRLHASADPRITIFQALSLGSSLSTGFLCWGLGAGMFVCLRRGETGAGTRGLCVLN